MWPWKKRKPQSSEAEQEFLELMGDVALIDSGYLAPGDKDPDDEPEEKPEEKPAREEKEEGEDGTSREVRAVRVGMEPRNTPRTGQFDPSKAAPSTLIALQSVKIATPCRADWSKMEGDHKSRFCQTCAKSVYNLSAMTSDEAQALIAEKNGDLCARLYRRADGTIITADCSVGATTPRRAFWGAGLAAIFGALLSGCGGASSTPNSSASGSANAMRVADTLDKMRTVPVVGALVNKLSPPMMVTAGAIAVVAPPRTMGKIARPKPTAAPEPTQAPEEPGVEPEMGDIGPEMGEAALTLGRISPPSSSSSGSAKA